MKYLEIESMQKLTRFLTHREVGARVLSGRLEPFSCKASGEDKKLAKAVDEAIVKELATSPLPDVTASSPLGSLAAPATRRLLGYLIGTLNASFPDYDFRDVKAEHFTKEPDCGVVVRAINRALCDVIQEDRGFADQLWGAVNEVMQLKDCQVFTYIPDLDSDPLSDACLWSFNYFFFNPTEKKVLFFTCVARSKRAAAAADALSDDDSDMEDMGKTEEMDDDDEEDTFFQFDDDVDM